MLLDGPGGWPVEPGWWKRLPADYTAQKEFACPHCGGAIPMKRRPSTDGIDDVSPGNLEILKKIRSPKVRKGHVQIYGRGVAKDWCPGPNWYMDEVGIDNERKYRANIAKRLGEKD